MYLICELLTKFIDSSKENLEPQILDSDFTFILR